MRKIILVAFGLAVLFPLGVGAHGGPSSPGEIQTGPGMMRYVEDLSVQNDELHEEMEDLMTKMMAGDLTQQEAERLTQLMEEYPGPMNMMMNRYGMGSGGWGMMNSPGWGMMGAASFWGWLAALTWIVWLLVGVLAIAWLVKQVQKK